MIHHHAKDVHIRLSASYWHPSGMVSPVKIRHITEALFSVLQTHKAFAITLLLLFYSSYPCYTLSIVSTRVFVNWVQLPLKFCT